MLTVWCTADGVAGPQGRYLFPSEVPFLSLLLVGLFSLSQRWGKRLVVFFVGFNTAVCLGVLVGSSTCTGSTGAHQHTLA
jgi:hypothetical protein